MNKIKLGILGGGGDSLIGILHRVASNMYDRYQIVGGVFNPNYEENLKFADKIGVDTDRVYIDFDTFIEEEIKKSSEERIEVVSVLTPNFLHFPMAKKLLENGFHVICEKPLTTSYKEAIELETLQKKHNAIFAVTYTYTGYPMVRHMKHLIASGALGEIQKTDVQYYQGWIIQSFMTLKFERQFGVLIPKKLGLAHVLVILEPTHFR
jgi:predicted dehydrogenase